MFGLQRRQKTQEKPLMVKDFLPEGSEGFKVDFKKLQRAINSCKLDKENRECREELKKIGVEWYDE